MRRATARSSPQLRREATLQKLPVADSSDKLIVLNQHSASTHHGLDATINDKSFKRRMIHVHVVLIVDADRRRGIGVPNNDVCIGSRKNFTLSRMHPK